MLGIILSSLLISLPDSLTDKSQNLDEVVITSSGSKSAKRSVKGQVASIDEHLSQLRGVNMVRRGSYALEPVVNSMTTERISTTIDGMKIFYACTDKMDPVTSYVESGNLQRIRLDGGLDGNPQATGNIGGSIDLKLRKAGFGDKSATGSATAGYESNGHLQVYGVDAAYSSLRFYSNAGAFYRHADNYRAGGGDKIKFSQFSKVNAFVNIGWQPEDGHMLETTFIFDRATGVGYPALTMDVSDATGLITSLSYRREWKKELLQRWESKVYYNHITHNMDDTHRPDVLIHMDMPGRSTTAGFYSLLQGSCGRHTCTFNLDAYYNTLFADMTMYVKNVSPMYMLTWPDVTTFNNGLSLSDVITLGESHTLRLSAKGSWQQRRIRSDEGFRTLSIYFPEMRQQQTDLYGRLSAGYVYNHNGLTLTAGMGYGSRTPTVTEAYGYFLNNTFDRYDYIGNPHLKNERAIELNATAAWESPRVEAGVEANAFLFSNYIIGKPDERLSAMTIGAAGVKVYQNQRQAQVVNIYGTLRLKPLEQLSWEHRLSYSYGREHTGEPLPLIAPLSYTTTLKYTAGKLECETGADFVQRQHRFSAKYGETPVAGYAVWHINAIYRFRMAGVTADLRIGIDNLFDRRYATYADWNHLPQKGRNVYSNLSLQL